MSIRNRPRAYGARPSVWAVVAFCGASVFMLGALMLVAADVSPY